jgi:hypothetical protein
MNRWKFDEIMELNGQKLTKKYIASLNKEEREALVEPIFQMIRRDLPNFPYPDKLEQVDKEWLRVLAYKPDLTTDEIFNNSSVGTAICKYFCHDYFRAKGEKDKRSMPELFQDDDVMRKLVYNRLSISWFEEEHGLETFNFSPKMIIQGMRSMRTIAGISMQKITVAKYITEKYSNEGDIIFDYSCGFGGRLLAAASYNRGYIGTDPLTVPDLKLMVKHFGFTNIELLHCGSEDYAGTTDSIDLCYSSPPYFSQERYSEDLTQAYNKGDSFFYDIYWPATLKNAKNMLKPNKWFGLILTGHNRMLEITKEQFGEPIEIIKLRTVRSHLNKAAGADVLKYEPCFMFRNLK